ncbi:hypothetical protein [Actinoplanes sp. NPDC023714]|uniref:hypothetical protein n=1 Tax=Actinoplanes sp. NPDC023714 TaxID=3154322 RepID=UPI00340503C5
MTEGDSIRHLPHAALGGQTVAAAEFRRGGEAPAFWRCPHCRPAPTIDRDGPS